MYWNLKFIQLKFSSLKSSKTFIKQFLNQAASHLVNRDALRSGQGKAFYKQNRAGHESWQNKGLFLARPAFVGDRRGPVTGYLIGTDQRSPGLVPWGF